MEKKLTSHIVKGIVISLVLIVLSLAGMAFNFDTQSWYRWLSNLLLFGSIIMSCIIFSNQNDHNVSFGDIFANGFKTTSVITCITLIFSVLLFMFMPDLKQRLFNIATEQAQKSGASDEMIEKQMEVFKKMFWVFIIGGVLVSYLIIGVIASLIGAAVAKKNPQEGPFVQQG